MTGLRPTRPANAAQKFYQAIEEQYLGIELGLEPRFRYWRRPEVVEFQHFLQTLKQDWTLKAYDVSDLGIAT